MAIQTRPDYYADPLTRFKYEYGERAAAEAAEWVRELGPAAACDAVARNTPGFPCTPRQRDPLLDLPPIWF